MSRRQVLLNHTTAQPVLRQTKEITLHDAAKSGDKAAVGRLLGIAAAEVNAVDRVWPPNWGLCGSAVVCVDAVHSPSSRCTWRTL